MRRKRLPGDIIIAPTRDELLAAELLVERQRNGVLYRYACADDAMQHLKEEAYILDLPRPCPYCKSWELCLPECSVAPWNLDGLTLDE